MTTVYQSLYQNSAYPLSPMIYNPLHQAHIIIHNVLSERIEV